MTALYSKAAPKIAEVLKLLYDRHNISNLARKYRDEARLENRVALELDAVLEEVSLCLQRLEQVLHKNKKNVTFYISHVSLCIISHVSSYDLIHIHRLEQLNWYPKP
jgi:hypothetical protein